MTSSTEGPTDCSQFEGKFTQRSSKYDYESNEMVLLIFPLGANFANYQWQSETICIVEDLPSKLNLAPDLNAKCI